VIEGDRRRSIRLEEVAHILDTTTPPRDGDSMEAEAFERLVEQIRAVLTGGGDETEQVAEISDLVGRSDALSFVEAITDSPPDGRRLAEAINGTDDIAERRRRRSEFLNAILS
jgi:hypothetical protein